MSSTYRVVVEYGVERGRPPADHETYWVGPEEAVQIIEAVISHQEERQEGIRLAAIRVTRFGGDAGVQRERLFEQTGY